MKGLDYLIGSIVGVAIFCGAPVLWKLGKKKKEETINRGKVYYGFLYYKIFLFYLAGIVSAETILMVVLGNSVKDTTALILTLACGVPFAVLYTYLYRKSFIKRCLTQNTKGMS